jgi:enamine deaminase RidA (YjgF/YER057c/UK114 family)
MLLSKFLLRSSQNQAASFFSPRQVSSSSPVVARLLRPRHGPAGTTCRFVHVEARLTELGIVLPRPAGARANYNVVCHASGDMLYVSGHLPFQLDGTLLTGKIGEAGRDVEYGYQAARWAGLNIISTLQHKLDGDLDRVVQVVKVFGIVQSTTDFKSQHLVMDGCSDVMMEVFGTKVGYHARSAIGTSTLPLDISVEVEAVVQIRPE